ncbi:MAG: InlB B-repeat-containing protein [Clostridia bacterium]|nr:InlB B-repeat-containing protein [Clostridia bacterium]
MNRTKKLLAICLALSMIASVFAVLGTIAVSAVGTEASGKRDLDSDGTYWYSDEKVSTYTSGTGTAADPYIITTAAQLRHLVRGNTGGGGKYYKLGCDIVINDSTNPYWYEESGLKNWIKGSDDTYGTFSDARNYRELGGELFRDNFDGDGHTISGLYINYNGTGTMSGAVSSRIYCGWGLFPLVYGATFKNVKLKDVYIKSNVTASSATGHYHGYGALVGNVHGEQPTTFQNVQVENVKFDITRPNLSSAGKPVGVGGIIGYSYGNLTVTDAVVKNVTAKLTNWYATSRCLAYIGAVTGAVGYGHSVTLNNVLTVGKMNPLSCSSATSGGAVTISSGNWIQDVVANLAAVINGTNCYAIGAEKVFDGKATLVTDEATFISDNLDTFYANIGASANWAAKKAGKMARLASFSQYGAVLKCDFSNYTTKADYANSPNANTNWTVATDGETGNKYLCGDLTTVTASQDYAFTITPNYAIGNGSNHTGYYQWGLSGVIEPGKIYKIQFKAKCDDTRTMKYSILNGYGFGAGYNNRGERLVDGEYDVYTNAYLTTNWQTYSTYFTGEYYPNTDGQGTNRPIFQVNYGAIGGHYVYFDDIVISTVSGVSFKVADNKYLTPFIGDEGDTITLPADPVRNGYVFAGWYTDAGCTAALDTAITKVGDVDTVYAKWEVDLKEVTVDFEGGSYTVGGANALNTSWSVVDEGGNSVLKRTMNTSYAANSFGFLIGNYTGTTNNTPIEAGKAYKITFKAKADKVTALDFAVFSGYSYALSNYTRDRFATKDSSTGDTVTMSPSVGNRVSLNTSWQEFTAYFTVEEYNYSSTNYTRPHFYITDPIWDTNLYFDDFELTQCDDAVNFNLYGSKYVKPFVAASGTTITMPFDPERADYIFGGWYNEPACTTVFTSTTVPAGNTTAYAKWTAAVKEQSVGTVASGTQDLGIKVTNANAYPIRFNLTTNGAVTVSVFTASASDSSVAKSVVWTRTLNNSGNIATVINPAVIKEGGVKGEELYVTVTPASGVTASVTNFAINGNTAPTRRIFEGDVNGDDAFDVKDVVSLKKMAISIGNVAWTGDINGDNYINVSDLTKARKWLLSGSREDLVTTKNGRALVWHDEFDGGKLNADNFRYLDVNRDNSVTYSTVDSLNYYDGKLNLKISNLDGTYYKVPSMLTSLGKMTYNKGYLEVKAKINAVPGQWAGIWLASETDQYSNYCGEIDIVETTGAVNFQNNIHSWKNNEDSQVSTSYKSNYVYADHGFNKTEYHIFGFEWDDTYITYYVDDVQYARYRISDIKNISVGTLSPKYPFAGIFDQYYAVRFDNTFYNGALSSDGAMPEFNIEYVRLYQKSGETYKIGGVLQ